VKRGQTIVVFDRFAAADAGVRQAEAD